MTDDRRAALLSAARTHFAVTEATTIADAGALLESFGAIEIPLERYLDNLDDEFVEREWATRLFLVADPEMLAAKATPEERDVFAEDPEEIFDPLEYGFEQVDWTTLSYEINTLRKAVIILECSAEDESLVGNFRVHGGAQWIRETLWAATGIVPRDPGAPDANSTMFGQAFAFVGRDTFVADPIENWQPVS